MAAPLDSLISLGVLATEALNAPKFLISSLMSLKIIRLKNKLLSLVSA
jgi:hypothetical protein